VNKRVEQGQATRARLVEVATRLFAERGFDGTSVEAVLDAASVSRGSLYHHFASKEALFEAVFQAVEDRIGQEILTTAAAVAGALEDPMICLRHGSLTWVKLAGDPVVQRIVLIDAPAVLGWERWRELEEQHALGTIKFAMQGAAEQGRVQPELVDVYAHMLLATVNEFALMIARADDQAEATRTAERAVDEVLTKLLGP
jgi:AcrR family transcriptional regulator